MTTSVKKKTAGKTTVKPRAGVVAAKKPAAAKKSGAVPKASPKKTVAVKKAVRRFKKSTSVEIIAQALRDKKAQNIVALDLTALDAAICNYFMIAHADSGTQLTALADNVEKEMHEQLQEKPLRVQGKENAFWIIMDYGDVVVHLFQTGWRLFYRLEELWADAVQKKYKD